MTFLNEREWIFWGLLKISCQKLWTNVCSQQYCMAMPNSPPPSTLFYTGNSSNNHKTLVKLIHKVAFHFCANLHCFHCWWAELLKSPFAMWTQLICTFCSYPLPIWKALWKQAVIACKKENRFCPCSLILLFLLTSSFYRCSNTEKWTWMPGNPFLPIEERADSSSLG